MFLALLLFPVQTPGNCWFHHLIIGEGGSVFVLNSSYWFHHLVFWEGGSVILASSCWCPQLTIGEGKLGHIIRQGSLQRENILTDRRPERFSK